MRGRRFLTLAVATALTAGSAASAAEPRAVIELFTSQGCSSCPPADKLLAEYTHDPSVVALSLAVDYWDYLGWKDTLALAGHTNRQRAYAKARGDREVYTPQAVINGTVHALGSDKAAIERAIRQTREQTMPLTVPVTVALTGDTVTVSVPAAMDEHAQGEVWLCPISKMVPVKIGRGENHGHTISYSNVVRRWIKLGDWTGHAKSWSVPTQGLVGNGIDEAAVLLQGGTNEKPRAILGAALASLR